MVKISVKKRFLTTLQNMKKNMNTVNKSEEIISMSQVVFGIISTFNEITATNKYKKIGTEIYLLKVVDRSTNDIEVKENVKQLLDEYIELYTKQNNLEEGEIDYTNMLATMLHFIVETEKKNIENKSNK